MNGKQSPVCVLMVLLLGVTMVNTNHIIFTYNHDINDPSGEPNWLKTFAAECSGEHQSPVNIDTSSLSYSLPDCSCLQLSTPNSIIRGPLVNNGHTAELEVEEPEVTLSNIPNRTGTFILDNVHIHYGGSSEAYFKPETNFWPSFLSAPTMLPGSEHRVNSVQYDAEFHFVFFNSEFETIGDAVEDPNGVAVVSFLVKSIPDWKIKFADVGPSVFLKRNIPFIHFIESRIEAELDLSPFFNGAGSYFTYTGSLTTPNCLEVVQFVVMKSPVLVTESALYTLSRLDSFGGFNSKFGNFRSTQPLNGRVVETNSIDDSCQCPPIATPPFDDGDDGDDD